MVHFWGCLGCVGVQQGAVRVDEHQAALVCKCNDTPCHLPPPSLNNHTCPLPPPPSLYTQFEAILYLDPLP